MSASPVAPRPSRRSLRTVALTATAVGCLLAPLAFGALWLRDQLLDTNAYVATVAPLSSNPAIDAALASELTDELFARVNVTAQAERVLPAQASFLAGPLASGVRSYTDETLVHLFGSSEFRRLWIAANREAHEALVAVLEDRSTMLLDRGGTIAINLRASAGIVQRALRAAGIPLFKDVPPSLFDRTIVLARSRTLGRAQLAVRILRDLAIGLPIAALVLLGAGVALVRERRRAVRRTGLGLAVTSAFGIAAIVVGRSLYLDQLSRSGLPLAAEAAFYDTVLRELASTFRWLLAAGVVLTIGAALAGPSPFAVHLRTRALQLAGRIADETVGERVAVGWVAANKFDLRAAVAIVGAIAFGLSGEATLREVAEIAIAVGAAFAAIEVLSRPLLTRLPESR